MDLSQYVRVGRYDLPEPNNTPHPVGSVLAQEASGVTYNWDTGTLFITADGGTSIVEVSKTGQLLSSMTLATGASPQGTEFYDPEGITYVGGGQFVITEERDRNAVKFTYEAGGLLTRNETQTVHLGTFVNNVGLEGLSYDPMTGGFIFVKEISPEGVFQTDIDFAAGTATNGSASTVNSINLFDPALVGVSDFADVFALSNLPATDGTPEEGHLLILSQEAGKIVEVDRAGNIISSLTIVADPTDAISVPNMQHEGLTMDRDGFIYVVNENGGGDINHPELWVYAKSSVANQAPTAIDLNNEALSILENTSTVARIRVADLVVSDDGIGTNTFTVAGADAAFFEADATGLYLKAGTVIDFETKSSYAVTVQVDDVSVGATPDASVSYVLSVGDVAVENVAPALYISEVAPWSSGNSPVGADWIEITNGGSSALDITGWKLDDGSHNFANAVAMSGVTSIAAGESVIFLETNNLAAAKTAFINTWFGGVAPAGLQFGAYSGGGVGLSTGGDGVSVFDATGVERAKVDFGASPSGPYASFDNAAGQNNATISALSQVGVHGAIAAANDASEIGSPGSVGELFISEVAPWSSGNSPVSADWFEVTNTTAFDIDITGWKMDDNSQSPAGAVALNGVTTIKAGESVIFLESNNLAAIRAEFIDTWFGGIAPQGLQIGNYTGGGVGLSTGGDQVNLYDAANNLRANVVFGASPSGPNYATFENAGGKTGSITTFSAVGTNGAYNAIGDAAEIGSPGSLTKSTVIKGDGVLVGSDLADLLLGGSKNDNLDGGKGFDWLIAGRGNDTIKGGAGSDVFLFNLADGKGQDKIVDFSDEDVLLTDVKIKDSNNDGLIWFAGNNKLDLASKTQVTITSDLGAAVKGLEYDGVYHDAISGHDYFVYSLIGSEAGLGTFGGGSTPT